MQGRIKGGESCRGPISVCYPYPYLLGLSNFLVGMVNFVLEVAALELNRVDGNPVIVGVLVATSK